MLVLVVCAANLFATWAAWNTHSVAADYLAGLPGVGEDELLAVDDTALAALWVNLIAIVASVAVFLTWLWRARVNSEAMSNVQHRLSRGWTIGAWFCPVVNLWFPRRIMDDIWRASRPDVPPNHYAAESLPQSPLVRAWWLAVVVDYAVQYLHRIQSRSSEVTLGSIKTQAIYSTISTVLVVVAGVLLVRVIREITGWQAAPVGGPQGDSSGPRPELARPRPDWGGERRS
ncbi:hypothetical protein BU204_04175 [Actinophytocola xanthii]|uniref:DUF4328 domain-containing protein n=1 Tax=Actinophytocola xanthii TaxID=1912961 RepID=A0A1Q8CXI6_9PSEU|nr:hypothetical protein BU204_04175 [Actinophytocola xanthii]